MKRPFALCLFSVTLFVVAVWQLSAAAADDCKVITGEILLPEISGAAMLPGDRLLLVGDDKTAVYLLEGASKRLLSRQVKAEEFQPLACNVKLDDLEDVAWDRDSSVYLVTSHSLNRQGENKDKRHRIALLQLKDGKPQGEVEKASGMISQLLPKELQSAEARTPAQAGFNIEGAAWNAEGHLLLGLRSPTRVVATPERTDKLYENAIILRLKNPQKLFGSADLPELSQETVSLDGRGIRGMYYDDQSKGCWILASLSPDPNYELRDAWSLWFWDEKRPPAQVEVPQAALIHLRKPEAVCRVMIDSHPYLLLIEDGDSARYALFAVPALSSGPAPAGSH
ncbi:MAG TPA: hypothetical protein VJ464_26310 [Blastocatellia bacterium]|nr:hypothetical protein [Blastocatellia bacterium]